MPTPVPIMLTTNAASGPAKAPIHQPAEARRKELRDTTSLFTAVLDDAGVRAGTGAGMVLWYGRFQADGVIAGHG